MRDSSLDTGQQNKHNKEGTHCDYLQKKSMGFFFVLGDSYQVG
jgi:hypothetical protein